MKNKTFRFVTRSAIIAAIYAVLTIILHPYSFGAIQLRLSEAMTLLPVIMPEAVPGLFVGCVLSNMFSSNMVILDIIFGGGATLIAAYLTSKIKNKYVGAFMPVLANGILVSFVITVSETTINSDSFFALYGYNILTVALSEAVVCYLVGIPLLGIIKKVKEKPKNK